MRFARGRGIWVNFKAPSATEKAERLKARALAAGTPAMRAEFLRLASMYEMLASRTPAPGLSKPPPADPVPE